MWVEFIVGSRPCSASFSPGFPVFLPPQKPTLLIYNLLGNLRATGLSVPRLLHVHATLVIQNQFIFYSSIIQSPPDITDAFGTSLCVRNTVNSRYSGHLPDVVFCPEKRESVIPGGISSQTSIQWSLALRTPRFYGRSLLRMKFRSPSIRGLTENDYSTRQRPEGVRYNESWLCYWWIHVENKLILYYGGRFARNFRPVEDVKSEKYVLGRLTRLAP